ncbi:methyltransferase type 11 [Sesbania bispinosa]|nr:methyltransferase type 11 [Sesbania bispinosa]
MNMLKCITSRPKYGKIHVVVTPTQDQHANGFSQNHTKKKQKYIWGVRVTYQRRYKGGPFFLNWETKI